MVNTFAEHVSYMYLTFSSLKEFYKLVQSAHENVKVLRYMFAGIALVCWWRNSVTEYILTVYIVGAKPRGRDEYNCFDGYQCIPMEIFCDEIWTVYIVSVNPCGRDEYNCFDGYQCIPMEIFCDEIWTVYIVGANSCGRDEYNCFNGHRCIPMEKLCDEIWTVYIVGVNPCGRDEYNYLTAVNVFL